MDFEMYIKPFLPLMIRIILGSLFFFQAYHKVFKIGLKETNETIYSGYRDTKVPEWFIRLSVMLSTYIELIGGILLVLGLFKPLAMIFLGINLILVTIGFSFLKGIWDMQHVFPRLVLLIALFLIPFEWDVWSLDSLIR